MTSASLLIVLLVGTVVGALTGLVVGGAMGALYLAIVAGFLGAIIAAFVRNFIMTRASGVGPNDLRTPVLVLVYSAVASLAGSAAAKEVSDVSELSSAVWIGALAGLFSAILLALLLITYHTNPGEPPRLRARR
jgi:tellurite resistance protein TehA-like permease